MEIIIGIHDVQLMLNQLFRVLTILIVGWSRELPFLPRFFLFDAFFSRF